jgi:hypothetical protein
MLLVVASGAGGSRNGGAWADQRTTVLNHRGPPQGAFHHGGPWLALRCASRFAEAHRPVHDLRPPTLVRMTDDEAGSSSTTSPTTRASPPSGCSRMAPITRTAYSRGVAVGDQSRPSARVRKIEVIPPVSITLTRYPNARQRRSFGTLCYTWWRCDLGPDAFSHGLSQSRGSCSDPWQCSTGRA